MKVTRSEYLVQTIQATLVEILPQTYHYQTAPQAPYPRLEYELHKVSEDGGKTSYLLEVHAWYKTDDAGACLALLDAVADKCRLVSQVTEYGLVHIYIGSGAQMIPDNDKNIKHARETYGIDVWYNPDI